MCHPTRNLQCALFVALLANSVCTEPVCTDVAQQRISNSMTSDDSFDGVSLLQKNSMKVTIDNDINQITDGEVTAKQDTLHDLQSARMLMDVNFGVLGNTSVFMLNKSRSPSLMGLAASKSRNGESDWVDMKSVDEPMTLNVAPLTWVFGSYHKTGCQLTLGICWVLGGNAANNIEKSLYGDDGDHTGPLFNNLAWSNWFFEPNLDVITKAGQYRFVHMIRMPAAAIVSAYRYHCHIQLDTEDWLKQPMHWPDEWCMFRGDCPETFTRYGILPKLKADPQLFQSVVQKEHQSLMQRFFEAVHDNKTLPEYYSSVPPTEGVIVEIYRSFTTLNMMSDNYERTRNDDNTVQVRMENIKDNFHGAMRCMFNFLARSHNLDVEWLTKRVDPLDVEKHGGDASIAAQPWHVNHDDNSQLFTALHRAQFVQEKIEILSRPAKNEC